METAKNPQGRRDGIPTESNAPPSTPVRTRPYRTRRDDLDPLEDSAHNARTGNSPISTARTRFSPVSDERLKELRALPYEEYLQTPEWRQCRDRALTRAGYRCSRCAAKRDLQVHHLSYARLGAEWDVDLEVLCRPCHEGHHFDEDRRQHLGIYVKLAAEAIHADQGATSLDLKADVRDRCRRLQIPANDRRIGDALDALLTRRLRMPATASVAQQPTPTDRPFTDTEAKAICRRLGIRVPFKSISAARWCDPDDFARQEAVRRELDIERY